MRMEDYNESLRVFDIANRTTAGEVVLEGTMNRKKRLTEFGSLRNQIECYSLGDKKYKFPTYDDTFFKGDGVIVGSTNIDRKKTTARMNKVDFSVDKTVKWPLKERVCFLFLVIFI